LTSDPTPSSTGARPRRRDPRGGFDFEPHRCFACGELNEQGLRLVVHTDPDGSWTETTLATAFQGWESVAHGGVICTILDEVMLWAVIGRGSWGVTARLNVTFRRPIATGRPIRAVGRVVEHGRRASRATGEIRDMETDELLASGESTFVAVPADQLDRLQARYGMRRLADDAAGTASAEAEAGDTTDLVASRP